MKLIPYLNFSGDCEAAFAFYEQVFGGEISDKMTFAGSPMEAEVPPEWHAKIMHISMQVGDWVIMGSDTPPGCFEKPQGMSVSVQIGDPQKAEQIFKALAEDGTVKMNLEETFWAECFGMVTDRFGTPWMINCDKTL